MRQTLTLVLAASSATLALCGCTLLSGLDRLSTGEEGAKKKTPSTVTLHAGEEGYIDPGPWAGPMHQKHAGQVVFSSKPIDAKAESGEVLTKYVLGDMLYARYWARESPHNLRRCSGKPRVILRADVNGEHAGKSLTSIDSFGLYEVGDENTLGYASLTNQLDMPLTKQVPFAMGSHAAEDQRVVREWNGEVIPKLVEGLNTVRVVITLDCGSSGEEDPVVAEGSLQIAVLPGAKEDYMAKFGAQLPPSPHPENAKLAPRIMKVVDDLPDWNNEVVIGARVTSPDWIPVRHEATGILTHYYVDAVVVVRQTKEKNLDVCRIFSIGIQRDAAGGPLRWGGVGDNKHFSCSSAPK